MAQVPDELTPEEFRARVRAAKLRRATRDERAVTLADRSVTYDNSITDLERLEAQASRRPRQILLSGSKGLG